MPDTGEISRKPTRSLHELEEERALPLGDPGPFAWCRVRYAFAPAQMDGLDQAASYGDARL